jgi:hypothetical protein
LLQLKFNIMATVEIFPAPIEELVNNNANLSDLHNEDRLNLELVDVESSEGLRRIQLANSNVRWKGNHASIPSLLIELSRSAVDQFFEEVKSSQNKKFVTALEFFWGAVIKGDGTYETRLLYQPVFLGWTKHSGTSNNHLYTIAGRGNVYYIKNGAFAAPTVQEKVLWVKNYKEQIEIKHTSTDSFSGFVDGNDVTSIIFPFQTIYTLMQDNEADKIYLHSCVLEITHENLYPRKHSVLLSSELVNPIGPFAGKYANRSHLCPPCEEGIGLGFDLASA